MVHNNSALSFGLGLLTGVALGAAIGIMYAPHSGKVTREIINEKMHDASRRAEGIIDDAREKAEDIIKDAKAKIGK